MQDAVLLSLLRGGNAYQFLVYSSFKELVTHNIPVFVDRLHTQALDGNLEPNSGYLEISWELIELESISLRFMLDI